MSLNSALLPKCTISVEIRLSFQHFKTAFALLLIGSHFTEALHFKGEGLLACARLLKAKPLR